MFASARVHARSCVSYTSADFIDADHWRKYRSRLSDRWSFNIGIFVADEFNGIKI